MRPVGSRLREKLEAFTTTEAPSIVDTNPTADVLSVGQGANHARAFLNLSFAMRIDKITSVLQFATDAAHQNPVELTAGYLRFNPGMTTDLFITRKFGHLDNIFDNRRDLLRNELEVEMVL